MLSTIVASYPRVRTSTLVGVQRGAIVAAIHRREEPRNTRIFEHHASSLVFIAYSNRRINVLFSSLVVRIAGPSFYPFGLS